MLLDVVLGDGPVVIFIDEIDATRVLPFDSDEFFAAIRESFNRRISAPEFEHLTFCLLGVAIPSDLIRNPAITPFNIGERILLEDFTLQELEAFAPYLGPNSKEIVGRVHFWTGGHPYLTQTICQSLAAEETTNVDIVDAIVRREFLENRARESNINLADVANIALHYGNDDATRADTLSTFKQILAGRQVDDDESRTAVVVLKLSGIVRSHRGRLIVRNRIYERVFDVHWIEDHMPDQELRRQRQSFLRGVVRTALASSLLLVVFASIAALAWYSRLQALDAQARLAYELYVADMNGLSQDFVNGDTHRIEAVLNRYKNSPFKGFEWAYWLRRYHDSPEEYTLGYSSPGKRCEGHISTDGKQICLVDKLTNTATLVDRASKRVILTKRLVGPSSVFPMRSRWAMIRLVSSYRYDVVDFLSGKVLLTLGGPDKAVRHMMVVDHSDFIAIAESPMSKPSPMQVNLCNMEAGKAAFTVPNVWTNTQRGPLMDFSPDARYFLYEKEPSGKVERNPDGVVAADAVVLDLQSKSVVDQFPVDSLTTIGSNGIEGDLILLINRGRGFVRKFTHHETSKLPSDSVVEGGAIAGDTVAVLQNGGTCAVWDMTKKAPVLVRRNVFSLAPGAKAGQYLASSSSVRIYDDKTPSTSSLAALGQRVTHATGTILNIFGAPDLGIAQVDEASFRRVGGVPDIETRPYTYGGRWYLTKGPAGHFDVLNDSTGVLPPTTLPFAPGNWSGGRDARSIVIWRVGDFQFAAFSAADRKIRWSRKGIKDIDGIWVSPDGSRAFYSVAGKSLSAFDMADGHPMGNLDTDNIGPLRLTFSADGNHTFVCAGDGHALMFDTHTLKKLVEFRGNDQVGLTSADISPDGRRVVTTDRSGSWKLWDTSGGTMLMNVRGSDSPLSSAVFSSDGRNIVTAGDDNKVRVWRTAKADPTMYIPIDQALLQNLHR